MAFDRIDRLFLADHPAVQLFFHPQQLVAFSFQHAGHRDAGPAGQDVGDLHVGDPVAQQAGLPHLGLRRDPAVSPAPGCGRTGSDMRPRRPCAARHIEILTGLLRAAFDVLGAGEAPSRPSTPRPARCIPDFPPIS